MLPPYIMSVRYRLLEIACLSNVCLSNVSKGLGRTESQFWFFQPEPASGTGPTDRRRGQSGIDRSGSFADVQWGRSPGVS